MYEFNLHEAKKHLKRFNKSVTYIACESLLHKNFTPIDDALNPENIAERVVLLDGIWATQLFRVSGDFEAIATSLQQNARSIKRQITFLESNALEKDPEKVFTVAKKILPVILGANGVERENYSFASKFFHWCSPSHFPIVDSRARMAINKFQKAHGLNRGHVPCQVTDLDYVTDYKRWIIFYSGLIGSLSLEQRNELIRADFENQPQYYRRHNTLLRILDKAFYGGYGV